MVMACETELGRDGLGAHKEASIACHAPSEAMDELAPGDRVRAAKRACVRTLDGWHGIDVDDIKHEAISGGITNMLWKFTPPPGRNLSPVCARIFGENTELLIDRKEELAHMLQLNRSGFGAALLGTFDGGRFEQFLPCVTMDADMVAEPLVQECIAAKLRRWHSLHVESSTSEPQLLPMLDKYVRAARAVRFEDKRKRAFFENLDWAALEADLGRVSGVCERVRSPVVFCHNDLLPGNILVLGGRERPETPDDLTFIDFEYSSYNHRGFDFGNHWNEYAGLACDYSRYPTPEAQERFARAYLAAGPGGERPSPSDAAAVPAASVAQLVAEGNAFSLASHFLWAIWAIIQARYSTIDFDYFGYFEVRVAEMRRRLPEVEAMVDAMARP